MPLATISIKNQIVIPRIVRERLHIGPHAKVNILPINDDAAIIFKQPEDLVESMRGVGKELWDSLGGVEVYLKRERESWD